MVVVVVVVDEGADNATNHDNDLGITGITNNGSRDRFFVGRTTTRKTVGV
jgi:hypothetical protein